MPNPVVTSDEQPIFDALLEAGVEAKVAYNAVRRIRELTAHNIADLIESKFAGVNAKFASVDAKFAGVNAKFAGVNEKLAGVDAKVDAQNANFADLKDQLKRERAMLWAVIALLGAAVVRYLVAG